MTVASLVVAAIASAWWVGRVVRQTSSAVESMQHRIEGRSMAPTLWGTHFEVTCDECQFTWTVDGKLTLDASHICPQCGRSIESPSASSPLGPDVVGLHATKDLSIGQLVAIQHNDQLHVKRVVALPGDRVSLDRWRLMVNGIRIEDRLRSADVAVTIPEIIVDADSNRSRSRWGTAPDDSSWTRDQRQIWTHSGDNQQWLFYRHRNVHDNDRPSPIQDDYPGNVDLQRALFPVDRLTVSATATSADPCELTIAFWSQQGNRMAVVPVHRLTPFRVSFYDADEVTDLPVTSEHPVAIRSHCSRIGLSNIVVKRHVEYRLRPTDDSSIYPLTVPDDSIFVLGDNVPVSIDSRSFGPVPTSDVVGIVTR